VRNRHRLPPHDASADATASGSGISPQCGAAGAVDRVPPMGAAAAGTDGHSPPSEKGAAAPVAVTRHHRAVDVAAIRTCLALRAEPRDASLAWLEQESEEGNVEYKCACMFAV
jgi:hypothetical protein